MTEYPIPEDLHKQYEISLRNYSCVFANGAYVQILIERIAALEAQVAALSKPVSDEEWINKKYTDLPRGPMHRSEINSLIAARLAAAEVHGA